jgi:hypothetical protein
MPSGLKTAAEYVLVDLELPGRASRTVGVLVFDPSAGDLRFRVLEDWSEYDEDDVEVLENLGAHLSQMSAEMGGRALLEYLEETLSNTLVLSERRSTWISDLDQAAEQLFTQHVQSQKLRNDKVIPFVTHLPRYSLRAAATKFGEDMEVEQEGWEPAPPGLRMSGDLFVARVVGRSMEPLIPDGSDCIFRANVTGSRAGRRLLIQRLGATGTSGEFTVKKYASRKIQSGDDEWSHSRIELIPLNREFEKMVFGPQDEGREFRVLGEFVQVLRPGK